MDSGNANARALGSAQNDAMQSVTGSFHVRGTKGVTSDDLNVVAGSGAFVINSEAENARQLKYTDPVTVGRISEVLFDTSRVARTASETRGQNTALAPRLIAF